MESGLVHEAPTDEERESAQSLGGEKAHPREGSPLSRPLRRAIDVAVALCLATCLIHLLFVFLHVAPSNTISKRYQERVNGWIFPLFEQNWKLFAPNPESFNHKISVRTMHTTENSTPRVSDWFDLSAVDDAAVRHSVFPSHTAQNTLRRAWSSYLETHGGDDQPHSDRARMLQEYLSNIAADRVAAHRRGPFERIQLRVRTVPVAAPATTGGSRPTAPPRGETRHLPWWEVTPRAN
ncbi:MULTISPECIES: DUF5819 family protein [unclassified Streptomyces]|uniref:DUF5819 family protein n=1 Tax=unclassified Streptomyces TaxID=2593676 RepID=UPI002DD94B76|nr:MULTISPECIES: DUF5819 family protein [unclassified Streptomyces]WSA93616.1 DUF5819 family protein [Streptomyces sp. NBC_01795]WSB77988.1 DUF5819 family protein [Streptomyces sp. NBC_01775]WSS13758.1 DUF5819 family protein [Streptomyces sp. NBC_01186]WSS42581.1 DUF5819 family protein [Streptomyces sp. NBC_01187]